MYLKMLSLVMFVVLSSCSAARSGYQIMEEARRDQQGLGTALTATTALAVIPIFGPLLMIGADGFLIGQHLANKKDAEPTTKNGKTDALLPPPPAPTPETIYIRTTNGEPVR